ncbi:hypothetical protein HDU76_000066 [Blyttiomyces sp. JEL0837]|nr:hypothetical protein HDU76_000066 [Blyttiomyces sp. JEL0837]
MFLATNKRTPSQVAAFNEFTFAVLTETLIHSFNGVEKLVVFFRDIKKPFDIEGLKAQLDRLNNSTNLLEIMLLFGCKEDMVGFANNGDNFTGSDSRRPVLKVVYDDGGDVGFFD